MPLSQPVSYLLRWRRLHVALWGWWGLHDGLGWRRWWRWRMGVSSGRLVARRRRHRLSRGSHDVASLRRGVLGQHRGRCLIHGGRLRVLTGALPTQRHLAVLGRQLFSLGGMGIMSLVGFYCHYLKYKYEIISMSLDYTVLNTTCVIQLTTANYAQRQYSETPAGIVSYTFNI